MADNDEILTPKQRRMITALMGSPSVSAACIAAGVSRSTFDRSLKQPEFLAELRKAETLAISEAARALVADLLENHSVMRGIRDDETQHGSVRVRAAEALDAAALRWRQAGELEDRLLELERRAANAQL